MGSSSAPHGLLRPCMDVDLNWLWLLLCFLLLWALLVLQEDAGRRISHRQGYKERLQEIAKAHEHQMAAIQARNQHLEQQGEGRRRGEHAHCPYLCICGAGRGILYLLRLGLGLGLGLRSGTQSMSPLAERGSLSADSQEPDSDLLPLRALHLAYLQGGGSDPAVLAQMYDLQVEATALERAAGRQEHKERKKSKSLLPLPQGSLGVGVVPGVWSLGLAHSGDRMGPQTHLSRYLLDPPDALGPAPYDPATGFVIFYDFLLGLDPTFFQVCLVAGLYRDGQEMGKPTPLPVAYCQMGQSPPYVVDGQRGNGAILSAKQPVPRVRPSMSIALVMELQASGGFDAYGQEIQRLASRGWAKINLFDQLHQLISGRWKIPVRLLPVQPGLTTEQLNGIPQAGKTELYLRVVNARDADMQSMAEIDPGNAAMYQYPPTVSRSPRATSLACSLTSPPPPTSC
uniref:Coiled-coil domain-containing protein 17 n=1 Tax=Chrysemys picta bellii TaxID=8478 RepID=A0A8C3FD79_CHRPI